MISRAVDALTNFSAAKEVGIRVADEAPVEYGVHGCAPRAASWQATSVSASGVREAAAAVSARVVSGAHGEPVHGGRPLADRAAEEAAVPGDGVLRERGEEFVQVGGVGIARGVVTGG